MLRKRACWSSFIYLESQRSSSQRGMDISFTYLSKKQWVRMYIVQNQTNTFISIQINKNTIFIRQINTYHWQNKYLSSLILTSLLVSFNIFMLTNKFPRPTRRAVSFNSPLLGNTHHHAPLTNSNYLEADFKLPSHSQHHSRMDKIRPQTTMINKFNNFNANGGNSTPRKRTSSMIQTKAVLNSPTKLPKSSSKQLPGQSQQPNRRRLRRKQAINPYIDQYIFPYIHIHIIDKIKQPRDIEEKAIQINFEKIFKKLIRGQLMGEYTGNFMAQMERVIRIMVQQDQLFDDGREELQSGMKSISKKQQLLQIMMDLQWKGQDSTAISLVRYYCVPQPPTHTQLLQVLMQQLILAMYQKKNCNRDIKYVLMHQTGTPITHISQIYFSTQKLLIAPADSYIRNYQGYRRILQEQQRAQRLTLKQSIIRRFMDQVVKGKVQDIGVNYQVFPRQALVWTKMRQQQAQKCVARRSKLRLQVKRPTINQNLSQQGLTTQLNSFFSQYVSTGVRQRKQYSRIALKFQQALDPGRGLGKQSLSHIERQFQRLRQFNNSYDIAYNQSKDNSNKIFLGVLLEYCSIFNQKDPQQLQKLTQMISKVYKVKQKMDQVHFWQFRQLYQAAHGIADKSVIMKLVIQYLCFDQYGELSRQNFDKTLRVCLSCRVRALRVVGDVLWSWLQSSGVVQNDRLLKQKLCIWYQPVRVIYLLMLSIVFGSQYRNVFQMLKDMLNYE